MWSSASFGPASAASTDQTLSGAPSSCTAKKSVAVFWSLHMTPILFPPKAISEEMSSVLTFVEEIANGAPQAASLHAGLQTVALTQTRPPCTHVAQSCPVESL